MNSYGACYPSIPTLKNHNVAKENETNFDTTRTLWITMALLTRIQFVWDSISKVTLCSSQWEGWFLNLLSRSCFNNLSSNMNKTDPFKPSLSKKALDIYNLFNNSQDNMENLATVLKKLMILFHSKKRNFSKDY